MTTLHQPTSCTLDVNGLALNYLDWGNPGAPPVVCVHGYTSSAQAFNALARRLLDRYHVVALDVRGHGESAWSKSGAYQYGDQVADLAAAVDKLGLSRFALIGTSMGGIIAMAYAGSYPERLTHLVINDIGPDVEMGSQRITQMVGSRPDEFATLEDAMAYRRQMSPIVAGRTLDDQHELALGVLRQRPDGRWFWKMDPEYIRQRVQSGAPQRPALWPALARVTCPTLVVWGTDSDVISEAQARRMVETLPRGELVVVPGIGHAPTLVEPAVLTALERFLPIAAPRA
jgi:pimeloyl-ACP methyl ester carboxylesterase